MNDFHNIILRSTASLREAMRVLDKGSLRIALVCDMEQKLLGTITDGDIRRGLLGDADMQDSVSLVMNSNPKVVLDVSSSQERLKLMQEHDLVAVPIINIQGVVLGVETLAQALKPQIHDNPVFIMAGGFGTRLQPLTDHCPKPMLRVGDKPMLEHLINQFTSYGFHNFYISTHYLPEVIRNYFGDGSQWGISIQYVHENNPLGTGGALGLLPKDLPNLPLVMMNGDVLTKVDFTRLLNHHEEHKFDATMCVRELEYKVPFGVIESEGNLITKMVEKPTFRYKINTGIYVLSPECIAAVEPEHRIDLPVLLEQRIKQQENIGMYVSYDYWLDIGHMNDYQKAQQDIKGFFE